ncbi:AzlD domain-containing protein [Vallicoccus soli]|uniref:AzlD domain-containing protein n=1 Tax=Vallicoccus soli TaxID=2339232 RepID=A0A3A3Z4E6_9ACTN|nr:AzlD domain-containing protein [Vallicoccus soli]RJK96486.1 AzlD domain-containing protein [Vallicoccus soli]
MSWAWLLATCAGCYLLKLAGTAVPERVLDRPRVARAGALLPVALLAALTAVQAVSTGRALMLDARAAGLAAGVAALLLRAPFLVVVVVAAAVAAGVRALA